MSIKLFALTCGYLTGELGYLMEGGEGRAELPIPAYLIEHPKGRALFDTGTHPDCQHDRAARIGPRITGLFSFHSRRARRSASASPPSTAIRQRSTSSSTRISNSTTSATTRSFRMR